MSSGKFMAHRPSAEQPQWQPLREHAQGVARRAEHFVRYLAVPGVGVQARLAGYLHDLGKYREAFQKHRLGWDPAAGQPGAFGERRVPHSDAGAKFLEARWRTRLRGSSPPAPHVGHELPFVVACHHGALRSVEALSERLSGTALEEVLPLLSRAFAELPDLADLVREDLPPLPLQGTGRAFLIRFLLSALVDADRLDTEEHGSPSRAGLREAHAEGPEEMARLLARLQAAQERRAAEDARHPQPINALRREMYTEALSHAGDQPGFFRLTLPTGAGKTLTSLGFALAHAQRHGLRRVVYALPFTTIIDQTARVFRGVLEREGEFKVLEHHANLEVPEQAEGEEAQTSAADLATENWDAPIIVTTTVRLFQETLFGTRTAQLRRLHNLSGSVLVLDEVQTLPAHLLTPTLDALRFLVRYAGCSVVLCTATQPALDAGPGFSGLEQVRDLVPDAGRSFRALRRVAYELRLDTPTPWPALAAELREQPQALCIVNTRAHAAALYTLLGDDPAHFHLSTLLCPAHRERELARIRERLAGGLSCRVISTQLIEAGIDVDFPRVYRALGPLEAIVQAAGRCNREGRRAEGQVVVFRPEDHRLPPGDYEVRGSLTASLLREGPDLHDPEVFTPYFRDVYSRVSTAPQDFDKAHAELNFTRVAAAYRMMEDTVPVLIRGYDPARVDALLGTLRDSHGQERRHAWRALQRYTVNLSRSQAAQLGHLLTDVPELVQRAQRLGVDPPRLQQWPLTARYDDKLGLVAEGADELFTAF
ncbi:CRISPR-associated endonuclease Cas3'' [Deinococcus murrayi]|uniref:CRISPR-associated endonuclease Cas3'' n=1 Tax=Deinococcus murrayi TaxID=68910 RepID=UPI00068615BA|nr:CRISPR-associated endonuclease Cas3'' [Deinococcus murrayi]